MPRDSLRNRMQRPAPTPAGSSAASPVITVRDAVQADRDALQRLAQLDSSTLPVGRVIVAEVDGELWAALSLSDGRAVADPFAPAPRS